MQSILGIDHISASATRRAGPDSLLILCLSVCVSEIISRPLIGRKLACSDWLTIISTALRTSLGKYYHFNSAMYVPGEVLAFQQRYVRSWGSTSITTALRMFLWVPISFL